jgi:hypothetical protein
MDKESQRKRKIENGNSKTKKHRRRLNAEKRKSSDEEIEGEEEQADQEKDRTAIEAAAREKGHGTDERSGDSFETRIFADGIERTDRSVAGKVATKYGELIVEPYKEIAARAPHVRSASHDDQVASES